MTYWERRRLELRTPEGGRVSQRVIAKKVGVTPSAVSAWEREVAAPRLNQVSKLAQAYDVSERKIREVIFERAEVRQ